MAIIYMVHPQHGAKVAISEEEANYDEMNGWSRYNPETPQAAADVDEDGDEVAAPVNEMAAPKRRARRRAAQED